jgi:hypothetical protein
MSRFFAMPAIYLLLAAGFMSISWFLTGTDRLLLLSEKGVRAIANVTDPHCYSHNAFGYEFQVDDKKFTGVGRDGVSGHACASLRA